MAAPLKKILIANRGEIALRIIRTASKMGISTVGIFASADSGSTWIDQSSDAYSLGDGDISATYLNIGKILEIARRSGADAIHPGYGFLSENHLFARACMDQGITFIGPSPEILKLMGDKTESHRLAESLGIAVPERIEGSPREILAMEKGLDYPVLVKAAAGGGGKGMRLVRQAGELTSMLSTTSTEALNFFGDDRIYLEKYLVSPRHIEVQLLGDKHGNLVHLFERECSIQRRHQKIIEEAPAACLSESLRERILQAALRIGRAINFYGAGTVEFLLDDQDFYFLEINPRIQVEHGITEMITGIDLVKEQITIAGGFPLSFTSAGIRRTGHAIEARLFAEDPENNLLPSPGKIHYYREPEMEDVRIDSAVTSGSVVTADYDPLIAKIMVLASTREAAIEKLNRVLGDFVVAGLQHNGRLLQAITCEKDFLSNKLSTTYLSEKIHAFVKGIAGYRQQVGTMPLAVAAVLDIISRKVPEDSSSPWQWADHWRLVPRIMFRINDEQVELYYYHTGADAVDFYRQEEFYEVRCIQREDCSISFMLNGVKYLFYLMPEQDGILDLSDGTLSFRVERFHRINPLDQYANEGNYTGDGIIRAPMPGKVTGLRVAEHSRVETGDPLLTMESMKLENTLLAPCSGMIQHIHTQEGNLVRKNDTLLEIIPDNQIININNSP